MTTALDRDSPQLVGGRTGCAVLYIEGVPHLRLSEECGLAGLLLSRVVHADSPPATQRPITLDSPSRTAFFGTAAVRLTRTEFKILHRLFISGPALVPVERLLLDVWDYIPAKGAPDLVRTHLRNIREKFRRADVAEMVVEAIKDDRFYILTDHDWDEGIRTRVENILKRANPNPAIRVRAAGG